MQVQTVKVHPDGFAQTHVTPGGDARTVREPVGSIAIHSGDVGRGQITYAPRTTGEAAGDRARAALTGLPTTYAGNPGGPLHADPGHSGVYRDDHGQAYIKQGDQSYPARYDRNNGTWRLHSPDNPTAYAYPVKQDESGNWRTHGDVGLRGGWRGDPLAVINQVQHEIDHARQQIRTLTDREQQLTQQWAQLTSRIEQAHREGGANLSPSQAMGLVHELQSLSVQRANVLRELEEKNNRLGQLQQSLRYS